MFVRTRAAVGIAALFVVLTLVVSFRNIWSHLKSWSEPVLQRSIVRILIIVPIYVLGSFLSLCFPSDSLYFACIRDVYEAYVIYLFLVLIIDFAGGDSLCATTLVEKQSMTHPFPLCRLAKVKLGGKFLRRTKQTTLQFVIVKPVFAVSSVVMLSMDKFESSTYQWVLLVVYNVSYSLALCALLYMYLATKNMIAKFHPVKKFLAVKVVVFMTYYQGLAVISFPGIERSDGELMNDFILCVEMLFFAWLHTQGFPASEFSKKPTVATARQAIPQILSFKDVIEDTMVHFHPRNNGQEIEGLQGVQLLKMRGETDDDEES